ncbi:hypothetical protein SAMN05421741_101144 [Paenimyroides ummariense]|uniref:TonB protein C-terminal n=1 Tax=Paenimyroides ummariense TaxID=913024 RepID=A0A1I4WBF8_9FLAO|nr:hypothetical protein [Paenimyroides ummariense]SFN10672.1 hypothetical protein SAMN05421741_101144 [Paenimyroides ummariense]
MKNIFFVIFVFMAGFQSIAQENMLEEDNRIHTFAQVKAIPSEGLNKLKYKLAIELKRYKNEKGLDALIFQFIVEKDGSLSNIQVKNENLSEKNIQKAISVLKKSKWIPAKHVGKSVRSRFTISMSLNAD